MGSERYRRDGFIPSGSQNGHLEGRLITDGVRRAVADRQNVLTDLVHAIREYRKLADSTPLTLQGADYANAVQELNKAIDRAESLCSMISRQMPCRIRWRRHTYARFD
jgi:hypothetical protein